MVKSKKTKILKAVYILLITTILISCGSNNVSKKDVIAFMDEYYTLSEEGDFDLLAFCYLERLDRDELRGMYNQIHWILGKLKSTELDSYRARTYYRYRDPGKYFELVYKNKYENGEVTETITLFAAKDTNQIKITTHNYNSDIFRF